MLALSLVVRFDVSSDVFNYRLKLDLNVYIPTGYYKDDDYQNYFARWLMRHGCLVMVNYRKKEPSIYNRKTKKKEQDPELWIKVLEENFRREMIGF